MALSALLGLARRDVVARSRGAFVESSRCRRRGVVAASLSWRRRRGVVVEPQPAKLSLGLHD